VSTFYICPTPIGNLEDISERILKTLDAVDVIYCEDTRRAKKLIDHFSISTPLRSYFVGNEMDKINEIENTLNEDKDIALISDAGTPLISDPGSELIRHLVSKKFEIVSIPGPTSVITALTVSGFEISKFQFLGFIPKAGKERSEFLVRLFNSEIPTVCFTSPKRLLKDLDYFEKEGLDSELVICRELTKKFETIYRGTAESLKNKISENIKGEITIVIAPSQNKSNIDLDLDKAISVLIEHRVPKRDLAKALSLVTDMSVNDLYERVKDL